MSKHRNGGVAKLQRDRIDIIIGLLHRIYDEVVGYPTLHPARGKRFAVPIYRRVADAYGTVADQPITTPREVEPLSSDIAHLPGRLLGLYVPDNWMSPALEYGDVAVVWYPQGGLSDDHKRTGLLAAITDREYRDYLGLGAWREGAVELQNVLNMKRNIEYGGIMYTGLVVGTSKRSIVDSGMDNRNMIYPCHIREQADGYEG